MGDRQAVQYQALIKFVEVTQTYFMPYLVVSACVISDKHNSVPKKKQQVKQCPICKWTEANDFHIRKYGNSTAAHLGKVQIPESFTCTNCNCSENLHRNDINKFLDEICSALRKSSLETINRCKKTSCQDYVVPGWNDYVKEAHCDARNCYISFGVIWENLSKVQFVNLCEGVGYILNTCSNSVNKEKRWFELMLWQSPCIAKMCQLFGKMYRKHT